AIIREAAAHIADAAGGTVEALVDGRVEHEPAFTDRMLGRIEGAMEGYVRKGVRWSAKTLTDRGRGWQGREFSPHFPGVLNIDLEDYKVSKGFLAQAKSVEPRVSLPAAEIQRMVVQCEQMLRHTPDSFLFLYSMQGIFVVPAVSVVGGRFSNPHDLYARS